MAMPVSRTRWAACEMLPSAWTWWPIGGWDRCSRREKIWLPAKRESLSSSTFADYAEIVQLYLVPGLGDLKLVDLRDKQVIDLYEAILQINRVSVPAPCRSVSAQASPATSARRSPRKATRLGRCTGR
ncbi:hypothetical protein [Actinomadura bangladeshensis]